MHYTKQTSTLLLSLGVLLVIPACGPKYQSKQLKPLNTRSAQFEQTKDNVTLRVKQLNKQETNALFDNRASELFTKNNPIVPLQITITNNSAKDLLFNKKTFTLDICNEHDVISRITFYDPTGRVLVKRTLSALGLGISGLGIYPAAWLAVFIPPLGITLCYGLAGTFIYSCYSFITSDNEYDKCEKENIKIDDDFTHKTIEGNSVVIKANNEFTALLFANGKTFKPNFALTLSDSDNKKLAFDIDLRSKRSEYLS